LKTHVEENHQLKRLEALRRHLKDSRNDGAWIIQPENRRYLSGYRAEDTQITESSGSLLIDERHLFLVTDSRYTVQAQAEAPAFEIITIKKGITEELPAILERAGVKRLGFEPDYLTWQVHKRLGSALKKLSPEIALLPFSGVVEKMREIKDESEIKALETSAEMISAILEDVISLLEPGLSEKEVAWMIEDMARKAGAESLAFPSIVASGPNSAMPHAVPTGRRLKENEPVTLDVGVRLNGYCSDITRTVFLGEPDDEIKKVYRTVRKAQLEALKHVAPGVKSSHPDTVARKIIDAAGYGKYFGHGLGHGVGLATHEGPRLSPLKPVTLEQGMVVTVEPGIYIPGTGGVRLEETVVIGPDGARVITKTDHLNEF